MAYPTLLDLPRHILISTLCLLSPIDRASLYVTCRQLKGVAFIENTIRQLESGGFSRLGYDASLCGLPQAALNKILSYISPSDTLSLRRTCWALRGLPMRSDSRLYRTWHVSAVQKSPLPLKRLSLTILNDIAAYLCPSDAICLRLTCTKLSGLPMPEIYELTQQDKNAILDPIISSSDRKKARLQLDQSAMLNGEIIPKWKIQEKLKEHQLIALRRYEHDYGRAKKPLRLLVCNQCGKLKLAHHVTGFGDGFSGLSILAIKGRECIVCRIKRFDNLRVASTYLLFVNDVEMFACFLCKEARPLEEDGLALWSSLDCEELALRLVRGVALVKHKFCKRCFENRQDLSEVKEVNYSKLVTMLENMFPQVGRLGTESVMKRKHEHTGDVSDGHQAKRAQLTLDDRRTEEPSIQSSCISIKLPTTITDGFSHHSSQAPCDSQSKPAYHNSEADLPSPSRVNLVSDPSQAALATNLHAPSSPSLTDLHNSAADNDDDDDLFDDHFDPNDLINLIDLDPPATTPPISDVVMMSEIPAAIPRSAGAGDAGDDDDFGWSEEMEAEGVEDGADHSGGGADGDVAARSAGAATTSEWDRLMLGGRF